MNTTSREFRFGDCRVTETDWATGLRQVAFRDPATRRLLALAEFDPLLTGWSCYLADRIVAFPDRRRAWFWAYAEAQYIIDCEGGFYDRHLGSGRYAQAS